MVIPPNSTATLHLKAKKITKNGKEIFNTLAEIKESSENQGFVGHLESGRYEFIIEQ